MSLRGDRAQRIERVSLTVPDLDAAERFYRDTLGFDPIARTGRLCGARAALLGAPNARIASVTMRLGAQHLDLLAFDPPGRPYPAGSTASDLWFQHCAVVVSDMTSAFTMLRRFGVAPITRGEPETLPPNTGSVTAYKFRDPFGHPLECLHFPMGVGYPCWHKPAAKDLFLGIDHTAIAVMDAARSIGFYQNLLGFEVTSRSHNAGPEQSRLDSITGDRVDVVALSPELSPPHLELLAYRTGTRRPKPGDGSPADCAETRTTIETGDLGAVRARLEAAAYPFAGPETWDDRPGLAVSDPDGHRLILRATG